MLYASTLAATAAAGQGEGMECKTNRVRLPTSELVDRHIHLERASNVRDLGGYATRFGRTVRWGRLYRAGELAKITDVDIATLEALDLRLIYDLRTSIERERRPARSWGLQIRRLARDYRHSGADLPALAAAATPTAADMRDGMLALYRALPFDQADAFKSIFQAAAAGELPLLFNCAGGKDRTGALAALMLDLLGVARADIMADYLLSNVYLDAGRHRFHNHVARPDVDPAVWEPMLTVNAAYLDAMFAAIEETHGDLAGYFGWLGLGDAEINAIRTHLLEPE